MKRLFKNVLFFIMLISASLNVGIAQSPPSPTPPPPPSGGNNNGHDLGGNQGNNGLGPLGSPINEGVEIMILLGVTYAGFLLYKRRKRNQEVAISIERQAN